MAETLVFNIPTPAATEATPVSVYWYQSTDGYTWGAAVDNSLIADLTIDPVSDKYVWESAVAAPDKYHQVKTKSASGIYSSFGAIIPPRPTDPDMCTILADVVTFGMVAKAGIQFSLSSKTKSLHNYLVDSAQTKLLTDAAGRVTFNVMRGGVYEMVSTIIGRPIEIDTTGLTFVNVADLIDPA